MSNHVKLFTAFHKSFYTPPLDFIIPVWLGKNNLPIPMDIAGDDSGDHISHLNDKFSELTLFYWVWKNQPMAADDIWGVCHYRRYFTTYKRWYSLSTFTLNRYPEKKVIDFYVNERLEPAIIKKMAKADVIVPHPINVSLRRKIDISIEDQYKKEHSEQDWLVLKEVLLEKYPEYAQSFALFSKQTKMSIANMMIARSSTWNAYLSWLFDIIFEVDRRLPERSDPYQRRSVGFMAERLMNLYIQHNALKTDYMQLVLFDKK